jgi:hypothetical protein
VEDLGGTAEEHPANNKRKTLRKIEDDRPTEVAAVYQRAKGELTPGS